MTFPPERVRQELHAVADAQHRQIVLPEPAGQRGRAGFIDAGGTAGEDDACRMQRSTWLQGASKCTISQ